MEEQIIKVFAQNKVLTLGELKAVFNTNSRMTVFRKLKQLKYRSSYSHRGKYYTLDLLADYNEHGIWQYNQICFSKCGTLLNTVLQNINESSAGLSAQELEHLLHVRVHNTVLDLCKKQKIARQQFTKEYVYLSIERGSDQVILRKEKIQSEYTEDNDASGEYLSLFLSTLNEKQRRLFAGYESMKLGYGGDRKIATKTGLNVKTVSQGKRELQTRGIDMARIRKAGAGRPMIKKTKT